MEPSAEAAMAVTGLENSAHSPEYLRITTQGKMQDFVSYALKYLERDETGPLILHTFPPELAKQLQNPTEQTSVNSMTTTTNSDAGGTKKASTSKVTDTIPRLISVVEVIKREFLKTPEALSSKRLTGLYQYNKIGCIEDFQPADEGAVTPEPDRAAAILEALEGKTHLKVKQTPYMQVTLSKVPLIDLKDNHTTPQAPTVRKISKSAKNRAKKREKKLSAANAQNAAEGDNANPSDGDVMAEDGND